MKEIKRTIREVVDKSREELLEVSQYIYENPEVGFQEKKASARLVEVLKKHGFVVHYPLKEAETAFLATAKGKADRPHIAIRAEYDALPEIGHACGHNLIAVAALGAVLALRR